MKRSDTNRRLFDLLYPRRCPVCGGVTDPGKLIHTSCLALLTPADSPVCMKCGKLLASPYKEYCADCQRDRKEFSAGRSLFLHDRYIARSLSDLKYHNRREYAEYYALALAERYGPLLERWKIDLIVPVPIHKNRMRTRGFNQAALLAQFISSRLEIPMREVLERTGETKAQKQLGRHERRRNLTGVIRMRDPAAGTDGILCGCKNILLIDDIYTTGATMEVCARVLKDAGAKEVYFLTVSTGSE